MICRRCAAIVTDIEGTTTDIAFVHKVLFPYARKHIGDFIRAHRNEAAVAEQLQASAELARLDATDLDSLITQLHAWIDSDQKITPLKALQGMVWRQGYGNGDFHGHVYADAHAALAQWHAQGLPLFVYSSGSIAAQKLLFAHTDYGDLTPWFSGYFDTTTGGKKDCASYRRISEALNLPAAEILFLSDVAEELDAAVAAGMQGVQLLRTPEIASGRHPTAANFHELRIEYLT